MELHTDRKISSIEWMNDEGFIAHVYDSADTVAGVESSSGTGVILYSSMIVAVFDILKD